MLKPFAFLSVALLALAGCATGPQETGPSPAPLGSSVYVSPDAPRIALITAINNRSGQGGHSALLISTAQNRVLYDPAGTWWHRTVPERGDMHYGITPQLLDLYIDYHARETYHVVIQDLVVSESTAQHLVNLAYQEGAVGKARCGITISGLLNDAGFTGVARQWFPHNIMDDFARIPGVETRKVFDDSPDENADIIEAMKAEARAAILDDIE